MKIDETSLYLVSLSPEFVVTLPHPEKAMESKDTTI